MDHLHEELKQPVVEVNISSNHNNEENDDTESERSSIVDEQMTVFANRRMPSAVSCEATEVSDTDYETCDSGLSSENVSEATESMSGIVDVGNRSVVCNVTGATTGSASDSCTIERNHSSEDGCFNNDRAECCSITELSANVIGDVGDGSDIVKTDTSKCESGGGELGAANTVTDSGSTMFSGISGSIIKTNVSVPSLDSAIVHDSGFSMLTDPEVYSGSESSSLLSHKLESTRSTKSSLSSKKLSPRPRDVSESELSGRVRRTSEGSALQTPGTYDLLVLELSCRL